MATKQEQQMSKRTTKVTHSLASPFPDPVWTKISADHQQNILELLIKLFEPIGHYQRSKKTSNGKRRKRDDAKQRRLEDTKMQVENVPEPEIKSHVTVGFLSTQRLLEKLAGNQDMGLQLSPNTDTHEPIQAQNEIIEAPASERLQIVFVDRASQPPIMLQHIPITIALAARYLGPERPIWLITLPNNSNDMVCSAVGCHKSTIFGLLHDAPDSKPLMEYVKAHIEPVQPLSSKSASNPVFLPLNVETKIMELENKQPKAIRRQEAQALSVQEGHLDQTISKKRKKQSR